MTTAWDVYAAGIEEQFQCEEISLGPWASYSLKTDPKHMVFALSRYKFVAKMLEGKKRVVEIGCGDGFGLPIIAQAVDEVIAIDWDPRSIEGIQRRLPHLDNVTYKTMNLNEESLDFEADAVYWIDVLEHVQPAEEQQLMRNILGLMHEEGVLVTGTPNIRAEQYASPQSASQHVNLKSMKDLKSFTQEYFRHTFMFGMNDEVVHTGYGEMCHYLWSLGVNKRSEA